MLRGWRIALLFLWALGCACEREESCREGLGNGSFIAGLSGRQIHYEVHGTGPILFTVPNSWGLTLSGLRSLYRPLEEHVTLVYFDPRGMGASGPVREDRDLGPDAVREDFRALADHLGLENVNAIGWSNGATNLILLASESPELIERAVFVHGNASFLPEDLKAIQGRFPDLIRQFAEFQQEMKDASYGAEAQNRRVKEFDTEVWFPYMFTDREAGKTVLPRVFEDADFSWAHAQYTDRVWARPDFRDRLSGIRAKSLVIAGRNDMLPPDRVKEIADGIGGQAEFVVFEKSGHFAPLEETDAFVEAIVRFLNAS